jgi:hypothetical protein
MERKMRCVRAARGAVEEQHAQPGTEAKVPITDQFLLVFHHDRAGVSIKAIASLRV